MFGGRKKWSLRKFFNVVKKNNLNIYIFLRTPFEDEENSKEFRYWQFKHTK